MSSTPRKREIEVERAAIVAIVERTRCALSAAEHQTLEAFTEQSLWVLQELEAAELTLAKLRRELFGPSSEKTKDVLADSDGEAPTDTTSGADETSLSEHDRAGPGATEDDKPKAKGHGRNGADDYSGAERVCTEHETLKPGDVCPACERRKLHQMKRPAVRIRVTGGAPIRATVFEQQRLRCNTCGEIFTACAPAGAEGQRYDARVAAMISMLRYGTGLPFNRLDRLQECLGIPLPSSTQWEVVEKAADDIFPVYEELIQQSAGAQLLHNDDTKMPVLSLTGKRRAKEAPADDPRERTGMFTTGIVAVGEQFRAALFCTGRRHAGENLQAVLDRRAAELGTPKLMCDGLDRNLPARTKVELINCLAHGRRYYVDLATRFPDACRHVLTELGRVFRHDTDARGAGMSDEQRLSYHQQHSAGVMSGLKDWLDEQIEQRNVEPNSPLGGAIEYLRKRWDKLTRFLEVPGAPLTNNVVERALKRAIVHRKSSLLYRSLKGARVGDAFMGLIYTAEIAGVDPFGYLRAGASSGGRRRPRRLDALELPGHDADDRRSQRAVLAVARRRADLDPTGSSRAHSGVRPYAPTNRRVITL